MHLRTAVVLGMLMTLTLTGCGEQAEDDTVATAGGRPSATSSATSGATGPEDDYEAALKHVECMREHGVDMPDPEREGQGGISMTVPEGTDKKKVEAATKECRRYLPNGGAPQKPDPEKLEKARQMSKCIREHGFPDFPDPDENGGISISGDSFDPNDPKLKEAEKACGIQGGRTQGKPEGGSVR